MKITIEDAARCPRYTARVIRGVKVGPSPDWMVERLAAIGQRSINNIVDVTNYILFLFGQPLHAFDLDKLKNADGVAHIVVRAAAEGERLTTLDGEDRALTPDMTVISTPELGAVALAGVMGGLDTEVTDGTVDILLEAATFEPGRTSRTSRNLGLFSESSMRYERGVDDHGIEERSAAAAALIVEVAGGTVSAAAGNGAGIVDEWPAPSTSAATCAFRVPRFCAMMGADIPRADIDGHRLRRLGCTVADDPAGDAGVLAVVRAHVPPRPRARDRPVRGGAAPVGHGPHPGHAARRPRPRGHALADGARHGHGERRHVRERPQRDDDLLVRRAGRPRPPAHAARGPGRAGRAHQPPQRRPVRHAPEHRARPSAQRRVQPEPRREERPALRGGRRVLRGRGATSSPRSAASLAGVLAGAMGEAGWNAAPAPFDFFDGKGVVESLARELALPKLRFKALSADEAPHLQPGRAAVVLAGGAELGWVGELHPLAVAAFEADAPVVAFELDVEALAKASRPARDYRDVPTFPAVSMDVAFVVDEGVAHEKLVQCMASAGGKLLEDARLFDVYRDEERVGAGKKSMAYALTYRAADRTLTSDEVDKAHERLVKKVCAATGAEVRG